MRRSRRKTSRRTAKTSAVISQLKRKIIFLLGFVGLGIILTAAILIYSWHQLDFSNFHNIHILILRPHEQNSEILVANLVDSQLYQILLPNQVHIPVADGYGQYRIGAIGQLSQQERGDLQLAAPSLGYWMGLNITRTFMVTDNHRSLLTVLLRSQGQANLVERLWLYNTLRGLQVRQQIIDLNKDFLSDARESNQTNRILSSQSRSSLLNKILSNHHISQSGIQVSIVNTTGTSGLAGYATEILKGLTYDVVSITDEQSTATQTQLLVQDLSQTSNEFLRPMLEMLPPNVPIVEQETLSQYRSDVVLILGTDYKQRVESYLSYP